MEVSFEKEMPLRWNTTKISEEELVTLLVLLSAPEQVSFETKEKRLDELIICLRVKGVLKEKCNYSKIKGRLCYSSDTWAQDIEAFVESSMKVDKWIAAIGNQLKLPPIWPPNIEVDEEFPLNANMHGVAQAIGLVIKVKGKTVDGIIYE